MPKIIKMPDHLVSLIAAGEVVEHPANVIKELVENAIDANATVINIEVFNNGFDLILVSDNGHGMDKDDLHQAVVAHATSKILKEEDLLAISSMGFRGEALASIASVAKLKISSRQENKDGNYVVYQGGKCIDEGVVALNVGTKIEVIDLFSNVPARFKFLKSEFAEKAMMISNFDKLALANPNVSLSLSFDNKLYKQTSGNGNMMQLLEVIIGNKSSQYAYEYNDNIGKIKVSGYLYSYEFSKSNRSNIFVFINNRPVSNYLINQAIIKAYGSFLMTKRYPVCVLYIDIDPQLVDVNVHPQKTTVKLANELLFVYQLEEKVKEFLIKSFRKIVAPTIISEHVLQPTIELSSYQPTFVEREQSYPHTQEQSIYNPLGLEYIGQFKGTYLLFQNQDGLILMDQHAAAEKINYEKVMHDLLEQSFVKVEPLFPIECPFSFDVLELIKKHKLIFEQFGFVIDKQLVYQYPSFVSEKKLFMAIEELLEIIEKYGTIDVEKYYEDYAISISCKMSIKANHTLSVLEVSKLVNDLFSLKSYVTCPHGRPILISLTHQQVDKLFKRV